jgi:DNA replication and repair protein RecF
LKTGRASSAELGAFEQTLAPAAAQLIGLRATALHELGSAMQATYAKLTADAEPAGLAYEPNFTDASAEAYLARLESGRTRDAQFRTTLSGPHRDDFGFKVKGAEARDFASEGQQRSLVLALRLAQAAWFRTRSGICPVLLADDVLGELDATRRARFWAAIDPDSQVIATGTHLPDAELGQWQVFEVTDGGFTEKPAV